ncbi:MAG: hypothetical protein FK734_06475 [Asgard group archaeon]|nr:hypothetical protein [Asgard group archaeon]
MKKTTTATAFPTIPIIFLGGITPNRKPLYDTMGLAVTSLSESTRTETKINILNSTTKQPKIHFFLNNNKIKGKRGSQILAAVNDFMASNSLKAEIEIQSTNYEIFSGSSDSGLAALFVGLDDLFELNLSKEELLSYAMKGSESAGRSLFGGLTLTQANADPLIVSQLASEKDLESIRLFSIPFHYDSRISADEIHARIITHPEFNQRVTKIPYWVQEIKAAIKQKDFIKMLELAEENIRNAHELLEGVNLFVRKSEMLSLCMDIEQMRQEGILAYYLIGGGNLVTVATVKEYTNEVTAKLTNKKWHFYDFKVASGPKIISESNKTLITEKY